MKEEQTKKDDKNEEKQMPDEKGPFSHINTETTYMNTKGNSSISDSFARELGLSNKE